MIGKRKIKPRIPFLLAACSLAFCGVYLPSKGKNDAPDVLSHVWHLDTRPDFIDLKVLLVGLEDFRAGRNPYTNATNSFNYPSTWAVFSPFSFLGPKNLVPLGSLQILVFFAFSFWFFSKLGGSEVLGILVLFSPAVLLGLERGNCDILIFLGLGSVLMGSGGYLLLATIFFATLLKIYPVGSGLGWLHENRRVGFWKHPQFYFGLAVFFVVIFATFEGYLQASKITPRPIHFMSYGLAAWPTLLGDFLQLSPVLRGILLGFFYTVIFFLAYITFRLAPPARAILADPNPGVTRFFFAGAGCFLASNLIGYNWEYRLVFLVFCLPAISALKERHRAWFALGFGLIVCLCWQTFFAQVFSRWLCKKSHFYYLTDVINILLFVYLSAFLLSCWKLKGKWSASCLAHKSSPS